MIKSNKNGGNNNFDFTNRVVVITGAISGLGSQMARGFANQNANLVLLARRVERLEDLAKDGITVNAICPEYFETKLTVATLNTETFTNYMKATVPVGRYGKEGELNAGAIFLASEEASYVTGVILPIDGGYTCI